MTGTAGLTAVPAAAKDSTGLASERDRDGSSRSRGTPDDETYSPVSPNSKRGLALEMNGEGERACERWIGGCRRWDGNHAKRGAKHHCKIHYAPRGAHKSPPVSYLERAINRRSINDFIGFAKASRRCGEGQQLLRVVRPQAHAGLSREIHIPSSAEGSVVEPFESSLTGATDFPH